MTDIVEKALDTLVSHDEKMQEAASQRDSKLADILKECTKE